MLEVISSAPLGACDSPIANTKGLSANTAANASRGASNSRQSGALHESSSGAATAEAVAEGTAGGVESTGGATTVATLSSLQLETNADKNSTAATYTREERMHWFVMDIQPKANPSSLAVWTSPLLRRSNDSIELNPVRFRELIEIDAWF